MKLKKNTPTLRVTWFTTHASVEREDNGSIYKKKSRLMSAGFLGDTKVKEHLKKQDVCFTAGGLEAAINMLKGVI